MAYVFQKRALSRVTGDGNVKVHCRRHARTCVMRAPAPHGAVCKVEPGRAQRAVFVSVADDAGVLFPINEERVAHARYAKVKVARRRQRALMRLHRAERERFFHVFEIWRDQNGSIRGVAWDYIRWASRLHHNPRLVTSPVGITCNPKNGRPRGSDSGVPLMLVGALSGLW